MRSYQLLIIGAGAAGVTAAVAAAREGVSGICIVERDEHIGGVLQQCKHKGFGVGYFGEEMTGEEYASRLESGLQETVRSGADVELRLGTMVTRLTPDRHAFLSARGSYEEIEFERCILATGCRETTIQSLTVAGTRPEGIYTAGEAQRMLNIYGRDIGDDIVILGTGDIGQIMARHYLESGKNVITMIEQAGRAGGLERNRRNIIEKYNIPVMLRSTIIEIIGEGRISAVRVRNLDTDEEAILPCNTLVTAMGLIPERDILTYIGLDDPVHAEKKQLPEWLSLCGNCDYVHDIVDSVSLHAEHLASALANQDRHAL